MFVNLAAQPSQPSASATHKHGLTGHNVLTSRDLGDLVITANVLWDAAMTVIDNHPALADKLKRRHGVLLTLVARAQR